MDCACWRVNLKNSMTTKIDVYNAFSFNDGTEIITILSPNIVFIPNDYEYLHRSMLKAAKISASSYCRVL